MGGLTMQEVRKTGESNSKNTKFKPVDVDVVVTVVVKVRFVGMYQVERRDLCGDVGGGE